MAEYKRKYVKLSRYAETIVAYENDRCRQFKRELTRRLVTVTAIARWTDFSQLVETTLRVKQSLMEEEEHKEKRKQVVTITSDSEKEQDKKSSFTPCVSKGRGFKNKSRGKSSQSKEFWVVFFGESTL